MAHEQPQQRWNFSPLQSPVSDPPRTSPLLRLPAELRNIIYAYAFDSATTLSRYTEVYRPMPLPPIHLLEHGRGLRLTCRQLFQETTRYVGTYKHLMWNMDLEFDRIYIVLGERTAEILSIVVPGIWAFRAFTRNRASFSNCAAALEMFRSLEQLEFQGNTRANDVEIGFVRRKLEAYGRQNVEICQYRRPDVGSDRELARAVAHTYPYSQ